MSSAGDVTALLVAWGEGDQAAESELMEIVYAELKVRLKNSVRNRRRISLPSGINLMAEVESGQKNRM
jgi:hypothetical protein